MARHQLVITLEINEATLAAAGGGIPKDFEDLPDFLSDLLAAYRRGAITFNDSGSGAVGDPTASGAAGLATSEPERASGPDPT